MKKLYTIIHSHHSWLILFAISAGTAALFVVGNLAKTGDFHPLDSLASIFQIKKDIAQVPQSQIEPTIIKDTKSATPAFVTINTGDVMLGRSVESVVHFSSMRMV